ncbi:pre-mRNA 3'-end-processing factor FIP1-like isoform X2 [Denticeps clupeoides]|uniref:Pre-mRNA polyadenylation factor Fip1 domain-containing protein n=1 Tax=Denticeps clupeoides TaxID=299321 RepID=A0AAY4BG77_9TELE|nr:pre-mRNA 3'-end-processing factor FIP1-like isoform X2 [Denticeps clupeoides]
MATDMTTSDPTVPISEPVEDEEHWLYGDESTKKSEDNFSGPPAPSQPDSSCTSEQKEAPVQTLKGTEEDEDEESDSDDDDVKVTIGNIKTGAPAYMATGMSLSVKSGRGYALPAANKHQPKVLDIEAMGNFGGQPALEVDVDIYEDKPWRKPGADLSDYFNYGFNEETWKAYCEKQRRLQLGLEPTPPFSFDNKITVQQGRTTSLEKDTESTTVKLDYKPDFTSSQVMSSTSSSRMKAGPPPNRKLGGTIDVIGGQTGAIRRVEGRRREMQEQNPIQVLGEHSNKPQPLGPPAGPSPVPITVPPPHFLHPPPPVSGMPPPMHPPGIPPPAIPGLFPPPLGPPPNLLMPPVDGCPAPAYSNAGPPTFGYNSGEQNFISYPPVSSSHTPWGSMLEKRVGAAGGGGHWDYQGTRRERDRDAERERDQERARTPTTSEYIEADRYHYCGHEKDGEREYARSFYHPRDSSQGRSRDRDDHSRDRRHRDKEESSKHKSSKRKQHDDEGEGHRRHKHKKNKHSKEDKELLEVAGGHLDEHEHKD